MLNETEYLLFKLGEECGEAQQEASKCGIYGVEQQYTPSHETNWNRLRQEVHDVVAVYMMLRHHLRKGLIGGTVDGFDPELLKSKIVKVEDWMTFCRELGTLEKL